MFGLLPVSLSFVVSFECDLGAREALHLRLGLTCGSTGACDVRSLFQDGKREFFCSCLEEFEVELAEEELASEMQARAFAGWSPAHTPGSKCMGVVGSLLRSSCELCL